MVPIQTPYEREVLVEHIEVSTKRHGSVRLALNHRHWTISRSKGPRTVCASCSQWPDDLAYPTGSRGRLSVVSARAALCTDGACELAPAGAHA
jgi:hypothetical protein